MRHRAGMRDVVTLIVGIDVVIGAAWYQRFRSAGGLEAGLVFLLGIGFAVAAAWTLVLAAALARRRSWARWPALITFGAMTAGGLANVVDTMRRLRGPDLPYGAPPAHLIAPAVITALAVAVTFLVARRTGRSRPARRPDD